MSGLNANLKPETPQSSPFPVIETGIGYRVSGVGEKKQNSPFPVSVANGVGKGIGGLGLLTAGCGLIKEKVRSVTGPEVAAFPPLPKDVAAVKKAVLVLNRVAFGPRPGDVARVIQMGVMAYLEEQLADKMEEDPAVNWRVNNSEVHEMEESEPDYLSSMPDDQLLRELQQVALLRATYSRHQLRETLADFWTNHFNIYALKSNGRNLVPMNAENAIRPHVLGNSTICFRLPLTALP